MRIGEFARKHGITQDTIRHYLEMGLLVTEKNGGHLRFTEDDSKDMEMIIELKQLDFSLAEIRKILGFQRLSGPKTYEYRNHYLSFLEDKNRQIAKELRKYTKMSSYLNNKIKAFKMDEAKTAKRLGFPMPSIGLLRCPDCNGPLNLSDGTIEKNMITAANVNCKCGYSAVIQNGIYVDEKAVRKRTINGKPMPSKKEYLEAASPNYINFLYKGISMIIDNIQKYEKEPGYIMELEACVGFFLMQYIKHLPKNSTYILIDYDKDRIIDLKRNLEVYHEHKNFIFLCCDYDRLPLANSCIDIMIDFWMTNSFARSNNQLIFDIVLPFLKEGGLLTGAFPFLNSKSKDFISIEPELKDYFNKDRMIGKLEASGIAEIDSTDIGPVFENNQYNLYIKDKELYQEIYKGQKRDVLASKSIDIRSKLKKTQAFKAACGRKTI
ncbi:HTH-type transcriptional regulator ZntR [Oxobacter pfennigii]|uniref:HTH-type transcriptional regulator ZntR n=1 Tax=Oxobacter pfennigii TaxID=36849 RepID=A0A0N8NTR9_9CLOT|nr:MerR family transcriptional regulator [Oxobacter pfennigii]KPU45600.1 HTH-type transcriptional regulator ZntR [Oxobacter pfennigii]